MQLTISKFPPSAAGFLAAGPPVPSRPFVSTAVVGCGLTWWAVHVMDSYGLSLFIALPFCLGFVSASLYGYRGAVSYGESVGVALLSVATLGVLLILFAWEGAICLLMAAPLGLALAVVGASFAHLIQSRRWNRRHAPAMLSIVMLALPAIIGGEQALHRTPPVFAVKTAIEVSAPPEAVWKQVVAFSEIPAPREWYFRAGIAYPIRAEIFGQGPGAVRHCEFSTGPFVEPIQVWDEPHLLKFSVTQNPPPMEEWTPYSKIDTPHLDGFLVSNGGQFLLTSLPRGRTRLEGTTWYRHSMWPASYWKLWSDAIIHRIHLRILRHIQSLAENGGAAGARAVNARRNPSF